MNPTTKPPRTHTSPGPRTVARLACQRERFSLPEGSHYLNCAYMSPLSKRVVEAGFAGVKRKCDPTSIHVEDFYAGCDRARELFAALIGVADPARIAIIPAASYGIANAARNTPVAASQNIVVTHHQFPSNVYVWKRIGSRVGADVRTIEAPPGGGMGEELSTRVLDAIDARTAVVALPHVHWTDGVRLDLEAIGRRAREVGAALVVDGTQSVGAMPFNMTSIQPDAVICAAYKWLTGPYSIGLAYYGQRYDDGVPSEETWIGRLGSEDFRRLVDYEDAYRPGAARYDVGECSNFVLIPMLIAALEQLSEWGVQEIEQYCRALTRDLVEEAKGLGFGIAQDAWRGGHLFGLRLPKGVALERIHADLAHRKVSASMRGDVLRISPHVYNDAEDVEALRQVLRGAVEGASRLEASP